MDSFSAGSSSEPDRQTPVTVLVVDDDPVILESVSDLLRISGYTVLAATNGMEALEVLERHTPEVIVADIMMPHMDGYQFCQAVRRNPAWATIPFIFLTARGQASDIRHGFMSGADHYLTKPFEPEDLLVAVQTRLARMREVQAVVQTDMERMKQQLLNVFGHELRTPLSYVYGYVQLLREEHASLDAETTEAILDSMQRGADRLARLVEDLMLIVYLDSGAGELELAYSRRHANVALEIQEAVGKLYAAAEKRNVAITMRVPKELTAFCVPRYVQDVVFRLVDNAIKFSNREGGHVWVRAEVQDGYAVISVQDNGIGIDPAQQKHLFNRFRQIDREIMEQQGVGLGLAIAQRLVQLHGGDIAVESQPGEGSTFTVRLPIEQQG